MEVWIERNRLLLLLHHSVHLRSHHHLLCRILHHLWTAVLHHLRIVCLRPVLKLLVAGPDAQLLILLEVRIRIHRRTANHHRDVGYWRRHLLHRDQEWRRWQLSLRLQALMRTFRTSRVWRWPLCFLSRLLWFWVGLRTLASLHHLFLGLLIWLS